MGIYHGICVNMGNQIVEIMLSAVKVLGQGAAKKIPAMAMSTLPQHQYETLLVTSPKEFVYHVQLNRPKKYNAMNSAFWEDVTNCFRAISTDENCRVVVLSGNGKHFSSGLDLSDVGTLTSIVMSENDISKKYRTLYEFIKLQAPFTAIEQCHKPVIAAIHSGCIGGGVDMISATDIRFCSQDTFFQVKEVDLGLAADLGTLQRLPKIIGSDSLVRELSFTARKMFADEAARVGLVSRVLPDKEALLAAAFETASLIASKSPVGIQGTKHHLNYSRDHTTEEGLHYMVTWNAAMLQSNDMVVAAMAAMDRSAPPPVFAKL